MAARRRRQAVRSALERVGSPWVVTVLGLVVVLGVLAVFVGSLLSAWDDRQQARRAQAAATVTRGTVDALVALQLERGLVELFLASGSAEQLGRLRTATVETDQAIADLAEEWRLARGELTQAGPPTVGDFLVAADSLDELRGAIGGAGQESTFEAYVALVDTLLEADRSLRALAVSGETSSLHSALSAMLRSAEALGRERALVARVVGAGEAVARDEQVRLSLLEREVQVSLDAAGALLGEPAASAIEEVRSPTDGQADALLTAIEEGGGNGEYTVEADDWFREATERIDRLVAVVDDVNGQLEEGAARRLNRTARSIAVRTAGFGSLLLVSIAVAVAAIATSRERARALGEYAALADGLLGWFLPETFPDVAGLEFAARYVPSSERTRAGGDWYDTYLLSGTQVALVIGDVAGHGPHASAQMAELRNLLRGQSIAYPKSPGDQLELLEQTLRDSDVFATVLFGVLDLDVGVFTYARAGHPPALLAHSNGDVEVLSGGVGPPFGTGIVPARAHSQVAVPAGSVLLLYTDGLVESRRRDIAAGISAVAAGFPDPAADLEAIADLILASRGDATNEDDIALLAVRLAAERS